MAQSMSQTLPAPSLKTSEDSDKWQREFSAFVALKPQLLVTHADCFVAVHNGQVVQSGTDEVTLALDFFKHYGNVPVHIGFVSAKPEPVARIPHYRVEVRGEA